MISDNKLHFQLNFTFHLLFNSECRIKDDTIVGFCLLEIRHTNNNIKMPVFYGF